MSRPGASARAAPRPRPARSPRAAPRAPGSARRRSRSVGVASDASAASRSAVGSSSSSSGGSRSITWPSSPRRPATSRATRSERSMKLVTVSRRRASSPMTRSDWSTSRPSDARSRSRMRRTSLTSWSAGLARRIAAFMSSARPATPGAELVEDDREPLRRTAGAARRRRDRGRPASGSARAAPSGAPPSPSVSGGAVGRAGVALHELLADQRLRPDRALGVSHGTARSPPRRPSRRAPCGPSVRWMSLTWPTRAPAIFTSCPGIRFAVESKTASTR